MDVRDLKNKIENNTLDDSLLILKYSDNKFLCYHYLSYIIKNTNKNKVYINSLSDLQASEDLFDASTSDIYILDVDDLKEYPTEELKNVIIICKTLPKDLTVDYIEIPKLLTWQIEDYAKMRLPGLSNDEVLWLCQNSKYNIYRLDKECSKLEIFTPGFQKILFKQQNEENVFCDLNSATLFNLTSNVIKRDIQGMNDILKNRMYIDLEPAGFITVLIKEYYKLLTVFSTNNWNSSLSNIISEKQFKYFKAVYTKMYTLSSLVKIYELLNSIDYKLKNGDLEYDRIIDYVIGHIMEA